MRNISFKLLLTFILEAFFSNGTSFSFGVSGSSSLLSIASTFSTYVNKHVKKATVGHA